MEKECKWTTISVIFPKFLEKELCMGKFCIPNFFLSKALNSKFTPKFIFQTAIMLWLFMKEEPIPIKVVHVKM